jgi:hypothetical protein
MKHTKNYIKKHGKALSNCASLLGVSDSLIERCIDGDEAALQEVGDKGNEGKRILNIMPYIRDNAAAFLKGTGEYNKSLADIYQQAGASGAAIDKASASTAIANLKYRNGRRQTALQLASSRTLENQRLDLVKLKACIDYHMSQVDHLYSEQSQYARPNNAQIAADLSYREERDKQLLTYGSDANLGNLPKKEYMTDKLRLKFQSVMSTFFE